MIILPLKINLFTALIFIRWESVTLFFLRWNLIHQKTWPLLPGLSKFFLNIFTGNFIKDFLQIKNPKYINSFIFIPHYLLRNLSSFNYNRYKQTIPDGDLSINRTPGRCDSMDTWMFINNTDDLCFPNQGGWDFTHKTTTDLAGIFPILFLLIP